MGFSVALSRRATAGLRRQLAEADRAAIDLLPMVPDEERARWTAFAQLEKGLLQTSPAWGEKIRSPPAG
jgi:CelD/BcsL family acetyltransferase involved in cellulose biosynthesis